MHALSERVKIHSIKNLTNSISIKRKTTAVRPVAEEADSPVWAPRAASSDDEISSDAKIYLHRSQSPYTHENGPGKL